MKGRLMIIGAGWEQEPLVKRAKDLGYWVLATHVYPNAEGFLHADATEVMDPRDATKAAELFERHHIDAVVSDNCDYALYTCGLLVQKFGVPGPNFDAVSFSNNKRKSRIQCEGKDILQPAFRACESFASAQQAVRDVGGYPVIVKPVDNRGNFGVNRVDHEDELKDAVWEAVANAHSREIIVEQFIEGTLMTVDGFSFSSDHHVSLAVASKKMQAGSKRVALEIVYPGEFDEEMIRRARELNDRVVKALHYDFGFTHSEYIVDVQGDIWLVESTNRGGGVHTSSTIVPGVTGLDLHRYLIQRAFGIEEVLNIDESNPMLKAAALSFFSFQNGKVKNIVGLEEARTMDGVLKCGLLIQPGDVIRNITTDANRHGYVVALAGTKEELRTTIDTAQQLIRIEYDE